MSIVDLQHLSYSFGDYWSLQNVSFSMEEGEFLFLTGPSGAGKTTLLRLLYGALPLERGTAIVAGFSLKKLPPDKLPLLRREVSVVFQDFRIMLNRSVYENVAIALEVRGMARALIDRRVRAVLRGLSLEKKSQTLAATLSGGEQQRVAIARAIVVNPKVLLADEPTGNLDPRLSRRIMELFFHFNRHGTAVILATHNPELIASLPKARVVALSQGQRVEAEDDPTAQAAIFCPSLDEPLDEPLDEQEDVQDEGQDAPDEASPEEYYRALEEENAAADQSGPAPHLHIRPHQGAGYYHGRGYDETPPRRAPASGLQPDWREKGRGDEQ